ncbi:hypothetical protein AAFC00_004194 [Neodothiora populina]|uniref:Rhodopsin domain-containing protein n=1 Tax=Neodothiora populina TaxID=2781224 RepID=A0ABR3PJZ1_9PEZI
MLRRAVWSDNPPALRSRDENYPTLLFSWCTGFAAVIILMRVFGRLIRTGRIFSEDTIMLCSLIPLLIRMGLVHVILLFGTNNVMTEGMTAKQIHLHSIGARLVLASRIFYAMFIWVSKLTVSQFLKRLARASWKRSYQRGLDFIRIFLLLTFIAVVIATLAECQPFDHYWQVLPDPGPQCRQGYAHLITMGSADIISDILLVCWPIPIIIQARMPLKRKLSLTFLFSLSLGLIAITATRVPEVIGRHGRQQYRTVWASAEILASAAVANAVVLGSFVRDRGIKRNKYKRSSTLDSIDRVSTRRPTLIPADSDEDLFRSIGCRLPPELASPGTAVARPAPVALTSEDYFMTGAAPMSPLHKSGTVHRSGSMAGLNLEENSDDSPHDSADALPKADITIASSPNLYRPSTKSISFWDVGGLLEEGPMTSSAATTQTTSSSSTRALGVAAHDFAANSQSSARPGMVARRSSRNIFTDFAIGRRRSSQLPQEPQTSPSTTPIPNDDQDVDDGGSHPRARDVAPSEDPSTFAHSRRPSLSTPHHSRASPVPNEDDSDGISLQDVGGLLER